VAQIIQEIESSKDNGKSVKVSDNHYIYIYLADVSLQDYEQVHQNYIGRKAFNKEKYNLQINDVTFGVSDYLTGYNQKMPFLEHHSASFNLNFRVSEDDAKWLFRFRQLKENYQLPNPLPMFVDKAELFNNQVVKIFHVEGRRIYQEIIEAIYEKEQDLGNYYLLNLQMICFFESRVDPDRKLEVSISKIKSVGNGLSTQKSLDLVDDLTQIGYIKRKDKQTGKTNVYTLCSSHEFKQILKKMDVDCVREIRRRRTKKKTRKKQEAGF
jgi:hypothetical protein